MSTASSAFRRGLTASVPIAMYPGDTWHPGDTHNSEKSLSMYDADYREALEGSPAIFDSAPVPMKDLFEEGEHFINQLKIRNPLLALYSPGAALVYIEDHGKYLILSIRGGIKELVEADSPADVSISSSALSYCFRFPWGGNTLEVNGRLQQPSGGDSRRFFHIFYIATLNNQGRGFPPIRAIVDKVKYPYGRRELLAAVKKRLLANFFRFPAP